MSGHSQPKIVELNLTDTSGEPAVMHEGVAHYIAQIKKGLQTYIDASDPTRSVPVLLPSDLVEAQEIRGELYGIYKTQPQGSKPVDNVVWSAFRGDALSFLARDVTDDMGRVRPELRAYRSYDDLLADLPKSEIPTPSTRKLEIPIETPKPEPVLVRFAHRLGKLMGRGLIEPRYRQHL